MHPFTAYRKSTGEVVRSGQASMLRDVLMQKTDDDIEVIEGEYPVGSFRIVDGQPVAIERIVAGATVMDVKAYAKRLLTATDWYAIRAQDPDGKPVPPEVWEYRAAVRAASNALEAMSPIPSDYRNEIYWPNPLPNPL